MAQGEFNKQEIETVLLCVNELFEAIPKSKKTTYLGHLNDILLFLEAAKRVAPEEAL